FFQAEDGIRDFHVTGVQTCALPISAPNHSTTEKQRDTRRRTRHGRPDAAQGGSQAARTPRTRRRTGRRVAGPRGQLGLRRPPVGRVLAQRLEWNTTPRPISSCRPTYLYARLTCTDTAL